MRTWETVKWKLAKRFPIFFKVKDKRLPSGSEAINLTKAKLCVSCDTIFAGTAQCPRCAADHWVWVIQWLEALDGSIKIPKWKIKEDVNIGEWP